MAEEQAGEQAAAAAGGVSECRDAAQSGGVLSAQSLRDLKASGGRDSPIEDSDQDIVNGDNVEHASAAGNTISATQTAAMAMGPPSAPASMFWTFETSPRAKEADDRITDLYIACRLVAVVVILFRAGEIRYAKVIGQFAVDLIGKEKWHECLPPYLLSQPNAKDIEAVYSLLEEAQKALKLLDLRNAAYLEGVMATME